MAHLGEGIEDPAVGDHQVHQEGESVGINPLRDTSAGLGTNALLSATRRGERTPTQYWDTPEKRENPGTMAGASILPS